MQTVLNLRTSRIWEYLFLSIYIIVSNIVTKLNLKMSSLGRNFLFIIMVWPELVSELIPWTIYEKRQRFRSHLQNSALRWRTKISIMMSIFETDLNTIMVCKLQASKCLNSSAIGHKHLTKINLFSFQIVIA